MQFLPSLSTKHPRSALAIPAVLSVLIILLAALPSFFPDTFSFLHPVSVDTDPENMLSDKEPVRVFHNKMKKEFGLYDMIVVGVVNTQDPDGVFNVQSLSEIYELADFAKHIQWESSKGEKEGVVSVEVMAPSTVDNIEKADLGTVRFEWLMPQPPANKAEALAVREKAMRLPMLKGTIVSEKDNALALYIPLTSKNVSFKVSKQLEEKVATFNSSSKFYVTGLPVAQDTFGVEMFVQMAISAPLAMLLIFLLMWFFFRKVSLIVSPLIVAMVSVIISMGLLVVSGNTIHIMSSMIPIFIMPIAVLDSVHILSEFFDRYQRSKDKYKTIDEVMTELSSPMLFTSLTTCAGFGSLALTPIPPVQVFGIFISIGVFFAWLFTVTMIPAYIVLMPDRAFEGFGLSHTEGEAEHAGVMGWLLSKLGGFTYSYAKPILGIVVLLAGLSYIGITKIQINDNPVKWFSKTHKIRVADRELNKRFAGTYMAYLVLESERSKVSTEDYASKLAERLGAEGSKALRLIAEQIPILLPEASSPDNFVSRLKSYAESQQEQASYDDWQSWDDALLFLDNILLESEVFKNPDMLRYISSLQDYLLSTGLVGKSNSVADIVKTVHRELYLGDQERYRIPETVSAVGQTLVSFQNSHRPDDLWHLVNQSYTRANIWIQLKSGDNKDMTALVQAVDRFLKENPAPSSIASHWFGLTYINVIWQDKMVSGMMEAFLGSFVIVLLLMTGLFRSFIWGLMAMIPLSVTIAGIYGLIGFVGKDYDMPVAVLSSLSLGLAVDYAIHFLARFRHLRKEYPNFQDTMRAMFGEPARAIVRNVIVIGVGFMPLLLAPLIPYQTVGALISSILLLAGAATLIILPALLKVIQRWAFPNVKESKVKAAA